MKFLIDNALSPLISDVLNHQGFDSHHVRDYNMQDADDEVIFLRAMQEDRIIVSADTDFGTLLSTWKSEKPSFILFRKLLTRKPDEISKILIDNLNQIEESLEKGCVVVFDRERIRIRMLPIIRE
ncbi:DUF5615 family PIN-like protein [Bacteroidota bacterium]